MPEELLCLECERVTAYKYHQIILRVWLHNIEDVTFGQNSIRISNINDSMKKNESWRALLGIDKAEAAAWSAAGSLWWWITR